MKKIISSNLTFEAAYGRGVRSANMIERYINHFNSGSDPYEYIGNPNLKAEVNNQFEVGLKGSNDKRNINFSTSVYYSNFENYIVGIVDPTLTRKFMPTKPPVNPKVFRNLDNAYKTGFEAMTQVNFSNDYFFKGEFAYVYAKNKDLDESLPLTPPFNTKLTVGVKKPTYWANIQFNLTSKQENIAPSFGETKTNGYQTVDLRLGFNPLKNTSVGFAILNAFDAYYHNHLNFSFANQSNFGITPITEPGRNITAFLQYNF